MNFTPSPHKSHDWTRFSDPEEGENLFCNRCEICTCCSPVASTEACGLDMPPTEDD